MNNTEPDFKWALAGTGKISGDFAAQVAAISGASLHSVYSRDKDNAESFRAAFGMDGAHDRFEELLENEAVDAVYVALPAALHQDYCTQALRAKKAVLCEKPFALDAKQAEAMLATAKHEGVFCMEAMWMRFSPIIQKIRSKAADGELGRIRSIGIQTGYATPPERLTDADPGRGALLNFGVYGVSLVQMLLGDPDAVHADVLTTDNGLDETCVLNLCYPDALATVTASIGLTLSNEVVITGTRGQVRIGAPFMTPGYAELTRFDMPGDAAVAKAKPVNALPKIDKIPFLGLAQGSFWPSLLRRRGKLLVRRRGESQNEP